ncbi:MAG: hypothetical protein IT436_12185 [Phycisphaerales bacterium]|nr:hypothetical protein [Phycisphaerales bacterium]
MGDRARKSLLLLVLGPALIGLSGCNTPIERRPLADAYVGEAGGSWAAVLPTPQVIAMAGEGTPENSPDFARRDYALGIAAADNLPPGSWPDDTRPSLDRQRRITLSTQSQTVIYFRPAGPSSGWGSR